MAINTKLSVSGLAGYKKDLASAKQAVKNLDDELALAEAEYKQTGNAADYYKRRLYLLQQQIQAQKGAVESAQKALDAAKTAYGENSTQAQAMQSQLTRARTALVRMQTQLGETERAMNGVGAEEDNVGGKTDTLAGKFEALSGKLDVKTLKEGLGQIADGIAGAAKKAANLAAELWKATTDAGHWADDLLSQRDQTGIDTTTLQRWRHASQYVDTEVDTILAARKRVEKAISGEDLQIGDTLIATTDAEGNLRGWEDVMWDAVEALGAMDNETERNQAAMELFGKNYDQMLPLIKAGREQWEKYMAEAPTLSEEQVEALGQLDDAVNTMNSALEGSKMQLLASLAPVMQTVAEAIAQIAQSLGEYLQTEEGQELLANLGDTLSGIAGDILNPENIEKAFSTLRDALGKVSETLGWISDNREKVVGALTAIGTAFAGLKVSQGVLTFVQLMSSGKGALGNLFGKGAAGAAGAAGNAGMNAGNAAATGATAGNLPLLLKGGVVAGAALAYTHGVAALGNTIDKLAGYEEERNRQRTEAENAAAAVAGTTYTDANKAAAAEAFMQIAELWGMVGSGKLGGGITGLRVTERGADNFDYQQGLYDLVDMAHENGLDLRAALGEELGKRVEEYVELSKLADKLNEEGDLFGEDRDRYEELMDAQAGIEWNQLGSVFEQVFDQMATYLTAVDEMPDQTETDGYNAGVGLANGMRESIPIVQEAGADLGKAATDAVESTLNIHSPSKVMAELGGYVGQGFALGIEDSLAQVRDASSALSAAAMGGAVARPRTPAAGGAAGLNADALGLALRSALSGVQVNMSGQAVGEIVADTVDEQIGRSAYNARYNV